MNVVGMDLHKRRITICVVDQERNVSYRKCFNCCEPDRLVAFLKQLEPFEAGVEATASYEWLVKLIEPLAYRVVRAHPRKRQIIAESTRKSENVKRYVEHEPVDVTTLTTTPTQGMRASASSTRDRVNGGVFRILFSGGPPPAEPRIDAGAHRVPSAPARCSVEAIFPWEISLHLGLKRMWGRRHRPLMSGDG
ncbi:MAG: hypothetical protein IID37_03535 [Planctomycetes bacterium]|nr:hypothetical protein [Planctomycetota bacterium]